MNALSDEDLVAQYRLAPTAARSRQLIDELIRRHHAQVVKWCYRFSTDRDRAADLAQDVFVKAYSSLDAFRLDSKFMTWLYAITRNRCRDDQRARADETGKRIMTLQYGMACGSTRVRRRSV